MASNDPTPPELDKTATKDLLSPVVAQAEAAAQNNDEEDTHSVRDTARRKTVSSQGHGGSTRIPLSRQSTTQTPIEQEPQPVYSGSHGEVDLNQDGFKTNARVADDGRVNIKINQKSRRLSELLVPALRSQLNAQTTDPTHLTPGFLSPFGGKTPAPTPPPLNIVIHVVGSRGDVQPFVALGKVLKEKHGHRVRLATHPTFQNFVTENGLEFFSIGGDPAELMAFMVKNPGLMPGMDTLRSGDIGKRRKGIYEIIQGCWRSCVEVGDGTGPGTSVESLETRTSYDSAIGMDDASVKPFVADAIIANPPSFAHVHCAEKLGIPLHLMFTMPWSPTQSFPHPLANIQSSNADDSVTNFVSYALVEMMTWQGLGDLINRFREETLGLEEVSLMWAPGMATRLRIPYTYCWSPALIPKPKDWGPHITISGFYFLSLAQSYTPEPDLAAFLEAGPPPVYIGFGSIVVDDPDAMTKLIFEAVKKTGQRALVSKGWGGFGADKMGIPEGVFMLGNVPHDWLFKHVSCVVHHGGAGTTAAGIALGKPTVVVPFFGDQPFWGAMVAKAGAGPVPVPSKDLTADSLAAAITEALKPTTLERAKELGAKIASEKGTEVGAQSFHKELNIDALRCAVAPHRAAVWRVKRTTIKLSAFAATTLANEGLLDFKDLKLYRPREYDAEDGPWDPVTGGASSLIGTMSSLMMGVADLPVEILKVFKPRTHEEKDEAEVLEKSTSANSSKTSLEITRSQDTEGGKTPTTEPTTPFDERQASLSGQMTPASEATLSPVNSKTKTNGSGAMASALKHSNSKPTSRNSSPHRSASRKAHSPAAQNHLDAAVGAARSAKKIASVSLKAPMDFTLALARGFHNAPKLYGDENIRQQDKITDLQSGLKVAGKEFGYGMYDGISGLVTQPIDGAKKEGFAGLIKGFGKGVGGLLLKPHAAFWGLPGYTFKGIYKEIQSHLGASVQNYIVAARTAQGIDEWHSATAEEKLDVIAKWQAVKEDLEKEKEHTRHGSFHAPQGFMKTRHMSFEERKKLAQEKKKLQKRESIVDPSQPKKKKHHHCVFHPEREPDIPQPIEFEKAIEASIAATSKGNPEEDKMIESALRASVAELQAAEHEGDEKDAMDRAIRASVLEAARERRAGKAQKSKSSSSGSGLAKTLTPKDEDDHDEQLEAALRRSLTNEDQQHRRHPLADADFDDSGIDTDLEDIEDENDDEEEGDQHAKSAPLPVRPAVPPRENGGGGNNIVDKHDDDDDDDGELREAIKRSHTTYEQEEGERGEKLQKQKTEEEIVLEYIKKQSLAEAGFKEAHQQGQ